MAGPPGLGVAAKLKRRGPFRPDIQLDPSQVVDERLLPMRRGIFWEDGSHSEFYPDPFPGGLSKPPDNYEARLQPRRKRKGGRD